VTYGTTTFAGSVTDYDNGGYYYLSPSLTAPPTSTVKRTAAQLVAAGTYSGPNSFTTQSHLFNLSQYVTQLASNDRSAATLAFDHKVSDKLTVFGDFMYSNTQTFTQLNAQPVPIYEYFDGDTMYVYDPYTGSELVANATAAAYNPFSPTVAACNRFVTHPRTFKNDTTALRGVVGLRGDISSDWSWEAAADYNKISQDFLNGGLVNGRVFDNLVADGTINLFSRTNSDAALVGSGALGTAIGVGESKLTTYDAVVRGKLFDLPAGEVKVAFGGEHRVESFRQDADVNSQTATFAWLSGTSLDPFYGSRKVDSVYGEIRVPVAKDIVAGLHYLELSAAVRHENYSDTENPTVPKFTLRWLPVNDEVAFHATYGKSFSAPTLFQLFGPGGMGYTDNLSLESLSGGVIEGQAHDRNGANSGLMPSKAESYTMGMVYSPKSIKGLQFSADYIHVRQKDLVNSIGWNTILQSTELLGPASPYAHLVHLGSFTGAPITAPGQISGNPIDNVFVTDTLINISFQKFAAFNFQTRYGFDVNNIGRFDVTAAALWWRDYTVKFLPDSDPYQTSGKVTSTNGTLPRWNGTLGVDWKRGNLSASSNVQFFPAVMDDNDSSRIPNLAQVDLAVGYTFSSNNRYLSGLKLTLGANNVFNKLAPLDPATFTDANADIATYGAIGRLIYLKAVYKF
jgi:iron complex outermembrane receptor protein